MIVVKFGGSSLATPQRMLAAARIVATHRRCEPVVCVVSAMAGVTDQLLTIATEAAVGSFVWRKSSAALRVRHEQTLASLTASTGREQPSSLAQLWQALEADAAALAAITEAHALQEASMVFSAWGERLSVQLFQAALASIGIATAAFEDAPIIVERDASLAPRRWVASVPATALWLSDPVVNLSRLGQTPVLPGYLALTQDGAYTTLGRNGSDHSAAVIGAALDASVVYLYSDVSGIYQADPRIVPNAPLLTTLTYDEAAAVAATGARVLHPATLPPLAQRRIPLRLRSVFDPDAPGTDIGAARTLSPASQSTALAALFAAVASSGLGRKVGRPDAF
jgi:aspartate kinase